MDDRMRRPDAPAVTPRQPAVQVQVVRNPGVALLLSLFLPGAGQIYNGFVGKGIAMLIACVICGALSALIVPLFVAIGIWIWAMVDAYQKAKGFTA